MTDEPTPDDLAIDVFAFRYALGRSSGAVPLVARRLKQRWPFFTEQQRLGIQRDICEAISMGMAGEGADVAIWQEMLKTASTVIAADPQSFIRAPLAIYVPRTGSMAEQIVERGSGIVAADAADDECGDDDDHVLCHYEGAIYDQVNITDMYSKLRIAAERLVTDYPTSAMADFERDELIRVGTFDIERFVVSGIENPQALFDWCGEAPEQVIGKILPQGPLDMREAAAIVRSPHATNLTRTLSADGTMWFKTQAGQLVLFDVEKKTARVYDHDAPELPVLLSWLTDGEKVRAIGSAYLKARSTTGYKQ